MNYLFLRGLARHQGHWHGFTDRFNDQNQILCIDIPGNGEFEAMDSNLSMLDNLEFVRTKFIERKNNNETPWTLIGISMGGMIALLWQFHYPDEFKNIFVINSSAANLIGPWKRFSINTFLSLPKLIFKNPYIQEESILKLTLNLKEVDRELINKNLNFSYNRTTIRNFYRQLICASKFNLPKIEQKNQNPFTIISSKKDRLVHFSASEKIGLRLNAPVYTHPKAGHDLPLDDGHWLFETIINSLKN
jgi:pimeloyl-ACP methyl ester carboxylesterase